MTTLGNKERCDEAGPRRDDALDSTTEGRHGPDLVTPTPRGGRPGPAAAPSTVRRQRCLLRTPVDVGDAERQASDGETSPEELLGGGGDAASRSPWPCHRGGQAGDLAAEAVGPRDRDLRQGDAAEGRSACSASAGHVRHVRHGIRAGRGRRRQLSHPAGPQGQRGGCPWRRHCRERTIAAPPGSSAQEKDRWRSQVADLNRDVRSTASGRRTAGAGWIDVHSPATASRGPCPGAPGGPGGSGRHGRREPSSSPLRGKMGAERVAIMSKLADLIDEHWSWPNSRTARPARPSTRRDWHMPFAADNIRYFATAVRTSKARRPPSTAAATCSTRPREPLGVVGQVHRPGTTRC